jgi:NTP pyrophosphatase (non-canonical NTP hydrolase)
MSKPPHLDLEKIYEYQRAFVKEREWDQFHTPKNLAMALAGEAGELLEIFQWLTVEESREVMKDARKAEAVRHEISDILFYLFRLADKLGVDLDDAFWEKQRLNAARYPADKVRGTARKYTEI